MLCDSQNLLIFGTDNLFSRLGMSLCSVKWIELLMAGCTIAIFILLIILVSNKMSTWIEWLYLKFSTRQ